MEEIQEVAPKPKKYVRLLFPFKYGLARMASLGNGPQSPLDGGYGTAKVTYSKNDIDEILKSGVAATDVPRTGWKLGKTDKAKIYKTISAMQQEANEVANLALTLEEARALYALVCGVRSDINPSVLIPLHAGIWGYPINFIQMWFASIGNITGVNRVYQLQRKELRDFHIMSLFPENNLKSYKNSYILVEETLRYVTSAGHYQDVEITDINKFLQDISGINPENKDKLHLSNDQVNQLITLNGGHIPQKLPLNVSSSTYFSMFIGNDGDSKGEDSEELSEALVFYLTQHEINEENSNFICARIDNAESNALFLEENFFNNTLLPAAKQKLAEINFNQQLDEALKQDLIFFIPLLSNSEFHQAFVDKFTRSAPGPETREFLSRHIQVCFGKPELTANEILKNINFNQQLNGALIQDLIFLIPLLSNSEFHQAFVDKFKQSDPRPETVEFLSRHIQLCFNKPKPSFWQRHQSKITGPIIGLIIAAAIIVPIVLVFGWPVVLAALGGGVLFGITVGVSTALAMTLGGLIGEGIDDKRMFDTFIDRINSLRVAVSDKQSVLLEGQSEDLPYTLSTSSGSEKGDDSEEEDDNKDEATVENPGGKPIFLSPLSPLPEKKDDNPPLISPDVQPKDDRKDPLNPDKHI